MQTFHVDIDLDSEGTLAEFLDLLSEHGSPRIVSYDAAETVPGMFAAATMVLEFTSYEDALAFAQRWFGESAEDAKEYVETITV